MRVKELIKELEQLPQDANILIARPNQWYDCATEIGEIEERPISVPGYMYIEKGNFLLFPGRETGSFDDPL